MGVGLGLEQQRRRMDPNTNEPLFTNCTRDFIGTHDYIFYSGVVKYSLRLDLQYICHLSVFLCSSTVHDLDGAVYACP